MLPGIPLGGEGCDVVRIPGVVVLHAVPVITDIEEETSGFMCQNLEQSRKVFDGARVLGTESGEVLEVDLALMSGSRKTMGKRDCWS